jgi:hypothetical protein
MTTELKPVRVVKAADARRTLARRIATFEARYEVPTAVMREQLRCGQLRETAEIAKWLHDANTLELLDGQGRSTAGSASAPTRRSTKPC